MNPAVFLVILCLAVASAAESPDATLDVKDQEAKITNEKPVGNMGTVQRDLRSTSSFLRLHRHKRGHGVNCHQRTP